MAFWLDPFLGTGLILMIPWGKRLHFITHTDATDGYNLTTSRGRLRLLRLSLL